MLFAHGTNHSKGVLILFSENLQTDNRNMLEIARLLNQIIYTSKSLYKTEND